MPLNLTKIIIDAQKYLVAHPHDLAHDIIHHYRTWEWCNKIVAAENISPDREALTIAAWWHDAEDKEGKLTKAMAGSLKKHLAEDKFINKVAGIIKEHSYGKKQNSLEAKILFDADKLEYVTRQRLSWFVEAAKDGCIDKTLSRKYYHQWYKRTPEVYSLLHFDFTKKKFKSLQIEALNYFNKINI